MLFSRRSGLAQLSPAERRMLAVLVDLRNGKKRSETGPTYESLSEACGVSRHRAHSLVLNLEARGCVRRYSNTHTNDTILVTSKGHRAAQEA